MTYVYVMKALCRILSLATVSRQKTDQHTNSTLHKIWQIQLLQMCHPLSAHLGWGTGDDL